MSDLDRLFATRWRPFHAKRELAASTQDKVFAHPGVYLLAYTDRRMDGQPVKPGDVFYVGMSNSAGGLRQRFRQFQSSLEGFNGHGPAYRFHLKCAKGCPYSQLRTKKRFFFAALPIPCQSKKREAKPHDWLCMGKVALLEYEAVARVLQSTGRLPPLFSPAKDALDDVNA